MSKRNKVLLGGGIGVLVVLLIVVSASAKRDKGIEVRFETVGRRDLVAAVTASGKIQPKKKVDISADITGRITKIAVREGDLVQKGQFLLQIDPTVYEANLERSSAAMSSAQAQAVQARATRDQSQRALQRTKELREQNPNLVSQEQLEQAQTAFDIADANLTASQHLVDQSRAGLQEARDQLAKTHLVAPMAGRVTRLAVEEGEVAVPGTFSRETGLLLTISDLSVIQTKVQVDETDVVRVHLGDSVEVTIDAFPDTTFIGRVTKISNSAILTAASAAAAGQNDRAVDYEVEITLSNPPSEIRPDLSSTARIVTDTRKQALAIPIIALTVRENTPVSTEQKSASGKAGPAEAQAATPKDTTKASTSKKKESEGVFIVHNGVATFRPVKVGIAGEEHFEVVEGVRQGDTIVAGPYQAVRDLKEGARVRPSKESSDTTNRKRS
ncbi:MAG TPA: efflux RND transporter periplasmic adaptor subunit [Gemmatimonadales bacterium]|nr:efflux RND transporter periplasmic adaptor subunit [Gemmatimonadales bacterium]